MTRKEFQADLKLLARIKKSDRELKQSGKPLLIEMEHPQAPLYLELETAFIQIMEEYCKHRPDVQPSSIDEFYSRTFVVDYVECWAIDNLVSEQFKAN